MTEQLNNTLITGKVKESSTTQSIKESKGQYTEDEKIEILCKKRNSTSRITVVLNGISICYLENSLM